MNVTDVDDVDDVRAIEEIVERFFGAFTSGDDVAVRMQDLRAAFLPGAVVIPAAGRVPVAHDVESFIAPRLALLTGGRLVDFSERPTGGRVELFGNIAHWFGRYEKAGVLDGAAYAGRGMKSLQFVRTAQGWAITAVAWDDEPGT